MGEIICWYWLVRLRLRLWRGCGAYELDGIVNGGILFLSRSCFARKCHLYTHETNKYCPVLNSGHSVWTGRFEATRKQVHFDVEHWTASCLVCRVTLVRLSFFHILLNSGNDTSQQPDKCIRLPRSHQLDAARRTTKAMVFHANKSGYKSTHPYNTTLIETMESSVLLRSVCAPPSAIPRNIKCTETCHMNWFR